MWIPYSICLNNFLSHQQSSYVFKAKQLDIIKGENKDDSRSNNNGSGKSAIIEAIYYALTGTPVRDINQEDLIKDDSTKAFVEFKLTNSVTEQSLLIKRTLCRNTASKLEITLDGKRINVVSVGEGSRYILDLLGITDSDLRSFYIVSKDSHVNFLTAPSANKLFILANLSQTQGVKADPYINDKITELEQELSDLKITLGRTEGQLESLNSFSFEEGQSRFEIEKQKALTNLLNKKESALSNNAEISQKGVLLKKQLTQLEVEAQSTREQYSKDKEDLVRLESERRVFDERIRSIKDLVSAFNREINLFNEYLKKAVTCPNCHFQFALGTELTIDQLNNKKKGCESNLITTESDLQQLRTKNQEIELSIQNKQKDITNSSLSSTNDSITKINSQLVQLRATYQSNVDLIKSLDSLIEQKNNEQYTFDSQKHQNAIKECEKQIITLTQGIGVLETQKQQYTSVLVVFKQFINFLNEDCLRVIQQHTNSFLSSLNTSLRIKLNPTSTTQSGKTTLRIGVEIVRDNGSVAKYGRFSGGERVRMNVANILAMNRLVNNAAPYSKGLDLLIIDEIIESVDSDGVESLLKALSNLPQTIIAITHTNYANQGFNQTLVVKEKGVSNVLQ